MVLLTNRLLLKALTRLAICHMQMLSSRVSWKVRRFQALTELGWISPPLYLKSEAEGRSQRYDYWQMHMNTWPPALALGSASARPIGSMSDFIAESRAVSLCLIRLEMLSVVTLWWAEVIRRGAYTHTLTATKIPRFWITLLRLCSLSLYKT